MRRCMSNVVTDVSEDTDVCCSPIHIGFVSAVLVSHFVCLFAYSMLSLSLFLFCYAGSVCCPSVVGGFVVVERGERGERGPELY